MKYPWKPVRRLALYAWMACYGLFLIYAAFDQDGFLFPDQLNLIVHEAGHLLFGWFGRSLGLWGGTIFELLVPGLLALYFTTRRELAGAVFCSFLLFENLLYISKYMADARAQVLPLITVGDPDAGTHDWYLIFTSMGVLERDQQISRLVRFSGWAGMIASALYFWLAAAANSRESRAAE